MYHVIRAEWNRFSRKMEKEVVLSTDDKAIACEYEDKLRKELRKIDETGGMCDCYVKDDSEKIDTSLYDSLTEEEKKDLIEIDGHRYIRKMWEALYSGRLAQA